MGNATEGRRKANPTPEVRDRRLQLRRRSSANIKGLTYETNQDAFLGGYLAAAMSKSGKVGTFGGQNIPPVTIYMDGFVAGVRYYDKTNNANVRRSAGSRSRAGRRTASPETVCSPTTSPTS